MRIFETILRLLTGFEPNEDMRHTIKGCEKLLSKAKRSIHIVAGDLDSELFEKQSIIDIFNTLTTREKNPVNIQIVFGPKADTKTRKLFEVARENAKIELIKLQKRPSAHFIVVDGKHTRVEDFHEQFTPERRAYLAYDTVFLGDRLESEFENLRSQAANAQ